MSTSSLSFQPPEREETLTKITQYGVEYPDGTIQWANAQNLKSGGEAIVINPDWSTANYNYYLADINSKHTSWGIDALRHAYEEHMKKQHAGSAKLTIVKRTIVIAVCGVESVPG